MNVYTTEKTDDIFNDSESEFTIEKTYDIFDFSPIFKKVPTTIRKYKKFKPDDTLNIPKISKSTKKSKRKKREAPKKYATKNVLSLNTKNIVSNKGKKMASKQLSKIKG